MSPQTLDALAAALGVSLETAVATAPLPLNELSAAERAFLRGLPHAGRRSDWLTGRAALKRLLRSLGRSEETSGLRFPQAELSLSHAGGTAIAVYAPGFAGLGVDLEPPRRVSAAAARLFLTETECRALGAADAAARLRLWTVKEALFKADPDNAGHWLSRYRVDDPRVSVGTARCPGRRFRYATCGHGGGHLSLAIAEPDRRPPDDR